MRAEAVTWPLIGQPSGGHKEQTGDDGREHDRQSRDAKLDDIEHAQADADEHDAGAKNRRGCKLEPRIDRGRQR